MSQITPVVASMYTMQTYLFWKSKSLIISVDLNDCFSTWASWGLVGRWLMAHEWLEWLAWLREMLINEPYSY